MYVERETKKGIKIRENDDNIGESIYQKSFPTKMRLNLATFNFKTVRQTDMTAQRVSFTLSLAPSSLFLFDDMRRRLFPNIYLVSRS